MLPMDHVGHQLNIGELIGDGDRLLVQFLGYFPEDRTVTNGLMSPPQEFTCDIKNVEFRAGPRCQRTISKKNPQIFRNTPA